jgi:hypothetical protein
MQATTIGIDIAVPRRPMRVLRETEVSLTYDGGNLLAGMSRMALCAYDACEAGDEQDAQAIFERLRRMQF